MSKITQKKLIEQLQTLKGIKPRQEWAVLLKSQILSQSSIETEQIKLNVPAKQAKTVGIMDVLSAVFFQKRLAYAFALVLFLVFGIFGFANHTVPGDLLFPVKKIAEQSQAALTGQTGLKQDVATLSSRINDLVQVAREGRKDNIPSAISEVSANAYELVKNLKQNPTTDQVTIREIATSLKTLADIPGTDLSANPDVKDLYKTLVESQIVDLEKTTLTTDQQSILDGVKDLYESGNYADALEEILTINN